MSSSVHDGLSTSSTSTVGPTQGGDATGLLMDSGAGDTFSYGEMVNGRYRVEGLLGEGAMGAVYRARDELRAGEALALKIIRGARLHGNRLDMFRSEFRVMTALRHPNVVRVFDFAPVAGSENHLFTMELVEGVDIFLATEDAEWEVVVDYLVQVCRALALIHSREIIHFDIKPGNIMIGSAGVVRLLDFGVAGTFGRANASGVCGTPVYMAPELLGGSSIDLRSDLYSLGITAYQLLCRRRPFTGRSPRELAMQHRSEPLRFDADTERRTPAWLREIITRLCAKEPPQRYRSANLVIDAINERGGFDYELETSATSESYVFSPRLVGREGALARALEHLRHARDPQPKHPPALFIKGPSGMGKSRVMREVRYTSQLEDLACVDAACFDGERNELAAASQLLRGVVAIAEALGLKRILDRYGPEVVKIVPTLGQSAGIEASPRLADLVSERRRLLETAAAFVIDMSKQLPLVLCLDDVQWADRGTLDWLATLLRRCMRSRGVAPIAVFGTYRDDEVEGTAAADLLSAARHHGWATQVALGPLDTASIRELLTSMLSVESIPDAFVGRMSDESAGNPYFIEEVLRALVDNGSVYIEGGRWATAQRIEELEIPHTMQAAFRRRARFLAPEERRALGVLAVAGRPLPVDIVRDALAGGGEDVFECLRTLRQRGMIVELDGGGAYQTAHDRIREMLVKELPPAQRRELHGRLGDAFARAHEQAGARGSDLGHLGAQHYARAERPVLASRLGRAVVLADADAGRFAEAAARAQELESWLGAAPTEAIDHDERVQLYFAMERIYETIGDRRSQHRVLSLLRDSLAESDDPAKRIEVSRRLGELASLTEDHAQAEALLSDALELATRLGDQALRQAVRRSRTFAAWRCGRHEEALALGAELLSSGVDVDPPKVQADDLANFSVVLRNLGQRDKAVRHLKEAAKIREELGDVLLLSFNLYALANLARDAGSYDECIEYHRRCAKLIGSHGLVRESAFNLAALASAYLRKGDVEASLETYEEALAACRKVALGPELAQVLATYCDLLVAVEREGAALPLLLEHAEVSDRLGLFGESCQSFIRAARLSERAGGSTSATWEQAVHMASAAGDRRAHLEALTGWVASLRREGDAERWLAACDDVVTVAVELGELKRAGEALNVIGIARWRSEDFDAALSAFRRARDIFVELADRPRVGLMRNCIGATLSGARRWEEAEAELSDAAAFNRAIGEQASEANALSALGKLFAGTDRPSEARAAYRRSLELRRLLGDERGARQVGTLLSELPVARGATGTETGHAGPAGATDIEHSN